MNRDVDIAIRKNYFEDSILLVGEFELMGHNMNYVLRVTSFGTKSEKENNVQVYFGLLDDTARDFIEKRYSYDGNKIRVENEKLMIRADEVEINETIYGLKVFVKHEDITLDFLVENDGHRSEFHSLGKSNLNNRIDGYSYPYCTTRGTALVGYNYREVEGQAFYVRRYQPHGGFFDRRLGQTAILRAGGEEKALRSLYGFFVLSNGRRLLFASYGNDREQDDLCALSTVNGSEKVEIEPILIAESDYGGEVGSSGKDITLRLRATQEDFAIKTRRDLEMSDEVSPEQKDFRMYDRFARLGGRFHGEKISGYGYMIYT